MGRLEFFLKLHVEHNELCRVGAFLSLLGTDVIILYDTAKSLSELFHCVFEAPVYSSQNLVMKCYDLHPPYPGSLALRP